MGVSNKKLINQPKNHSTSATSLMTRIQNGGRGYGKWKSELFFFKLHLAHTVFPNELRHGAVMGAE